MGGLSEVSKVKWEVVHDEKSAGIVFPPEIAAIAFDFPRDMDQIHALELPVEELPIEELTWHLDLPWFWLDKEHPFSLKPRDVIEDPELYPYWYKRIMEVDTSFPIDIMWWKGHWQILDGLHRLCQQVILGKKIVQVRKVPKE